MASTEVKIRQTDSGWLLELPDGTTSRHLTRSQAFDAIATALGPSASASFTVYDRAGDVIDRGGQAWGPGAVPRPRPTVDELRALRLRFMRGLREMTGGSRTEIVDSPKVASEVGIDAEDLEGIVEYLEGEGLIDVIGGFGAAAALSLTHRGLVEVEQSESSPTKPTEHFPPAIHVHIQSMTNSAIQAGTVGSTQVIFAVSSTAEPVLAWLAEFKSKLGELPLADDVRAAASATTAMVEAQLNSAAPSEPVVTAGMVYLYDLLMGLGTNLLAEGLIRSFPGTA